MKTYLVGGAVRDQLLGRPVTEKDWVVVGATPDDMLARGFRQVGRDFPVFLHPRTGEQYALARTERSSGPGHGDFVFHTGTTVTLADDLARRDLTINAMAQDDGGLIDPYGGRADLAAKVLRHVSPAFAEDPLRVFRVARFAAQLPAFQIHQETLVLMAAMGSKLPSLSCERVWRELTVAMAAPSPARFFEVVHALAGAWWFRELDLPATIRLYHRVAFPDAQIALAALGWVNDRDALHTVCARLKAPRLPHRAALAVTTYGRVLTSTDADAATSLAALAAIGAFRQGRLYGLVLAAVEHSAAVSLAPLRRLVDELRCLRVDAVPGPGYGAALRQRRLRHIERWTKLQRNPCGSKLPSDG